MAIFKKTTPREMKIRMIVYCVLFLVMMVVTTAMGLRSTGMIFFGFAALAAILAVYWARREAKEERDG